MSGANRPCWLSGTRWALGSFQSLLRLQESGSKAVGIEWPTSVWSCPQRARGCRSLAPWMDCLLLGLPGDLSHERILLFHPNPTRLVQAMRNHAALPKGRAQTSGRSWIQSFSDITKDEVSFSLPVLPPSGIGLIPRLASVWVARWLPPAFVCFLIHGLPRWLSSKETACIVGNAAGAPGSIPGSGRSPGGGNGNPLQDSCMENSMNRGAWETAVHGITESDMPATEHVCFSCMF